MRCYVLAGGRSRRFGQDKLTYKIGEKRVIERVVNTLSRRFGEIYIVTKDRNKFGFLGLPVVTDLLEEQASMVGLYTALKHSTDREIFVVSGDLPLLGVEVIDILIKEAFPPITLACTSGKVHTLVGVYWPDLVNDLEVFIRKKNFRLTDFVKRVGFKAVKIPEKYRHQLLNLNKKEDLLRVLAIENLS